MGGDWHMPALRRKWALPGWQAACSAAVLPLPPPVLALCTRPTALLSPTAARRASRRGGRELHQLHYQLRPLLPQPHHHPCWPVRAQYWRKSAWGQGSKQCVHDKGQAAQPGLAA